MLNLHRQISQVRKDLKWVNELLCAFGWTAMILGLVMFLACVVYLILQLP